jgi:hypothetical protein
MVSKYNEIDKCLAAIATAFDGLKDKNFSEISLITVGIEIYKYYFPNMVLDEAIKDTISIMRQNCGRNQFIG